MYDGQNFDGTDSPNGQILGTAQTRAEAVLVLVFNRSTSDILITVGGNAAATAWRTPFGPIDNAAVPVEVGGAFMLFNPVAAAYSITDGSDHLLSVTNASGDVQYDVLVLGRSA